jgi:hypothetical protein
VKVKTVIEMLQKLNPDEEIIVDWWERSMFSRVWDEDSSDLPNESKWAEVVKEWDEYEENHMTEEIWDWVHDGLLEKGAYND